MRQLYKIIAILLCISLLLSLAGCKENEVDPTLSSPTVAPTAPPTDPTVPTETDPTAPPPTEPQIPAVYFNAMDELQGRSNLSMTVTSFKEILLKEDTVNSQSTQQITWLGLGTEDLRAKVTETAIFGSYETKLTELYAEGKLYSNVYGHDFTSDMTAEAFAARYVPAVAVNSELYAAFTAEESDGAVMVHFSDATAPESWLPAEDAQWVSGNADVRISADGQVERVEYTAVYRYAGAQVTSSFTIDYAEPSVSEIKAPSNLKGYLTLSDPGVPRLIEQIYGYLSDYDHMSFSGSVITVVQAAGLYMTQAQNLHSYGQGKDVQAKLESNVYIAEGNKTQEVRLEELFINGKYTVSTNGGLPEANRSVDAEVMNTYILNMLTEYVPEWSYFEDVTCTDLGSLLLYEFTGSKDLAKLIDGEICQDIFANKNMLSDLASKYKADKIEYYIAVDKYLGLPTALGLNYEGTYTIDGQRYTNSRQVDQSFYMASLNAYEEIHNVSAPDTEPETPAKPLFYHVTGSDGQEMWLLGTIHIGDDRTGYLPQEIYDAFNSADALAVECNTRAFDEQLKTDEKLQKELSNAYFYSNGKTAKDNISDKELYEKALKLMKATGNYNFNAPYMKVALWAQSIENYYTKPLHTLSSDKGVDNRLLMMAEANGKKILEVESCMFQVKMFTGWSKKLSEYLLSEAAAINVTEYAASLQEMYELWCAGDEEALIAMINEAPGEMTEEELKFYNEYTKAMNWDRDEGMVETAIEYLESGDVVFYAVGLAHVLSEEGLVNSLREAGYTVELVEFN